MSVIMKQAKKKNTPFQARQSWGRLMRVKFSRTIRANMRDPNLFSAGKTWTQDESFLADSNSSRRQECMRSHRIL